MGVFGGWVLVVMAVIASKSCNYHTPVWGILQAILLYVQKSP
ncbi:hypothetical protein [Moraxella lacunata]